MQMPSLLMPMGGVEATRPHAHSARVIYIRGERHREPGDPGADIMVSRTALDLIYFDCQDIPFFTGPLYNSAWPC